MELMKFTTAISYVALAVAMTMNLSAAEAAKARSPLEGTWKWTYRTSDGAEVPSRVKFRMKDDDLTAVTSFRQGSDVAAEKLKFKGNQISFDVVRERDREKVVTHYSGELKGDVIVGKITSKLDGEELSYDWQAKRPSGIEGAWKWSSPGFGQSRTIDWTLNLKTEGETVTGKMKFGGGGGRGGGGFSGETEIHRGRFVNDSIYFETERKSATGEMRTNRFRGKLVGDKIIGKSEMNSGGQYTTNKWEPIRAE
jgi:hypothetical protein